MQTCHLADIYGESGTGNLHAEVEVDEVVFLAEVPVAERVLAQVGYLSAFLHYHVVAGVASFGHLVAGDVRDGAEQCVQVFLCLVHLLLQFAVLLFECGNLLLHLFGLLAFALLHEGTYLR